jgi:hypothetical protein
VLNALQPAGCAQFAKISVPSAGHF